MSALPREFFLMQIRLFLKAKASIWKKSSVCSLIASKNNFFTMKKKVINTSRLTVTEKKVIWYWDSLFPQSIHSSCTMWLSFIPSNFKTASPHVTPTLRSHCVPLASSEPFEKTTFNLTSNYSLRLSPVASQISEEAKWTLPNQLAEWASQANDMNNSPWLLHCCRRP